MNLPASRRLLLEADLVPMQGQRFQPTGFADLGAATYTLPDGTDMLLVESAQSMANRLEKTILTPQNDLIPELKGLSYVRARLTGLPSGEVMTSSLLEAHRLNAPFIMADRDFTKEFCVDAGIMENQALDWPRIAKAIFKHDVNSLLHGVFLVNLVEAKPLKEKSKVADKDKDEKEKASGRVKMPRLISAFIEACNVREVISGGVKNTHFDPSGTIQATALKKDVYGNVPYQRTEFSAERITAYFNLDVGGIRDLGLEPEAANLLYLLGLYKLRALLDGGLRLRTACDLRLTGGVRCTEPQDFILPSRETLLLELKAAICQCQNHFANPPVRELVVPVEKVKKKSSAKDSPSEEADTTSDTDTDEE